MSVILHDDDLRCPDPEDSNCTLCGSCLSIPFVQWMGGGGTIFFCNQCCDHIGQGLTADLIQIRAINALRALGYDGMTLRRDSEVSHRVEKFFATKRKEPGRSK